MMDTQFAKFLQIGIIVENVEETVKQYEKYGIGPWRISPYGYTFSSAPTDL